MTSERQPPVSAALAAEARSWIARREAGLDPAARHALQQWLAANPEHRRAFREADAGRTPVDWALRAGAVDDVLVNLEVRGRRRRQRRQLLAAGTACLLAGVVLWVRPGAGDASDPIVAAPQSSLVVHTARQMSLPDGSRAELRADGAIQVAFDPVRRDIVLQQGAAHFTVLPDIRRPFVVRAGEVEVIAVGTAFSVTETANAVEVIVTEGKVTVATPSAAGSPAPVPVSAGQRLSVARGAVAPAAAETLTAQEAQERLEWRLPRLEFSETPLREVVAAMNTHNDLTFVLVDPALGELELSGSLRADKVAALEAMLVSEFGLEIEHHGREIRLRR